MFHLAFICTANICRSPVMHFTFQSAIDARPEAEHWAVASRGTQTRHTKICPLSASLIDGLPGGGEFARNHRPKSVSARFVTAQHMLLTATRTERSIVAAKSPELRAQTFTLREATWLGEAAITASEFSRARGLLLGSELPPLQVYADILHGRRGLTPIPTAAWASRIGLRAPESHLLDIKDGHNESGRSHARALRDAAEQSALLARQIVRFLDLLD